jgi:tetratricopeptide (TPR) repeat protein
MKRFLLAAAILVLLLTLAPSVPATQNARTFMDGNEAYRTGDWPAAITAFESLVADGVENGNLFYNLGNAYLKNDDLGHALLWYERALKHIPHDPDLRFNYDYALTLTQDERGDKESPLLHILLNAVLWFALSVLVLRKKRLLRPSVLLVATATVVFSATAAVNFVETTQIRQAVIIPEKIAVRSGFSESAAQLFVLHAGTKVRVEREADGYLLIRYTEDKIGWVKKTEAGII